MNLEELLGDAYREDMSVADIKAALAGKKLVDLSTGQYVDKNKYNTDINKLQSSLNDKEAELKNKMTDDEKRQADEAANQQLIVQLQEQVKQAQIENNKNKTIATISESKTLLDVKDDNKEYNDFLNSLSQSDSENANIIATYFNNMIKNAYEKGKNDMTKDKLGKMGKQKTDANGKQTSNDGDFGKNLASKINGSKSDFSYFGKFNK